MATVVYIVGVVVVFTLLGLGVATLVAIGTEIYGGAVDRQASEVDRIRSASRRGMADVKQIRRETVTQLFNSAVEAQMRQDTEGEPSAAETF